MRPMIKIIPIQLIDENPYRDLATYPTNQTKVKALVESIAQVGFWEGVIARPADKRYQIAFGHHRLAAAKVSNLTEIPLILRLLDDTAMLQMMARENSDDYANQFLVMLNTWEAAAKFLSVSCPPRGGQIVQDIEIARLLGWIQQKQGARVQINQLARACRGASALIRDGHVKREDLRDLTQKDVRLIVERANRRIDQLEIGEKIGNVTPEITKRCKKSVAKAVKIVAERVRNDQVRTAKDIGFEVDAVAFEIDRSHKPKESPLLEFFAKSLAQRLETMLRSDKASEELQAIVNAIPQIVIEEDYKALEMIYRETSELEQRAHYWSQQLRPIPQNVIPMRAIENK